MNFLVILGLSSEKRGGNHKKLLCNFDKSVIVAKDRCAVAVCFVTEKFPGAGPKAALWRVEYVISGESAKNA